MGSIVNNPKKEFKSSITNNFCKYGTSQIIKILQYRWQLASIILMYDS